jgi:alkylation response protein AidB-like acyl-CoA dehydrogenase
MEAIMDFSLTEEQIMFRDLFRDFAQKEVAKVSKHTDEMEEPPAVLLKKAAAQGFLAATVPEDLGGAALDLLSYSLLLEEIARECMSTAVTLAVHNSLVNATLVKYGSDEQKDKWLPILAENLGGFAATEPDAGSDTSRIAMRAKRNGDGYLLSGVKTWVSNAGQAKALLVLTRTEGGPAIFIIDPAAPGVKIGLREPTTGLRGVTINTVYFDFVELVEADRVGAEGDGLIIAQAANTHLQLALAAAALGLAEGAVALGRSFAIERQFGVSIATKQGLGNYFADCEIEQEALRHLIEYAAWLAGEGKEYAHAALKAKMFGAKIARTAANLMLQVHGGYGFSDEYAISRLYRDAKALDFLGGTPQLGRVVIAQQVFADSGLAIKP